MPTTAAPRRSGTTRARAFCERSAGVSDREPAMRILLIEPDAPTARPAPHGSRRDCGGCGSSECRQELGAVGGRDPLWIGCDAAHCGGEKRTISDAGLQSVTRLAGPQDRSDIIRDLRRTSCSWYV